MTRTLCLLCILTLVGCQGVLSPTWLDQGHSDIDLARISSEEKAKAHQILGTVGQVVESNAPPTIGDAIRATGVLTAPLLGPAAPWALVGTSLLGALVTALERNRRSRKTVRSIIAPMEAARRRDLEFKLNNDGKGSFIIIDKAAVAPVHAANGAAREIARAT